MDTHLQKHIQENRVSVRAGLVMLEGVLFVPKGAKGIIVFAHGSGTHLDSHCDRFIAQMLHSRKLATLLIDLLTPQEEHNDQHTLHLGCDIDRLVARLMGVTNWLLHNPTTQHLKIGYLGDSTGSAAAVVTATFFPNTVGAIACYNGHLDLAGAALFQVRVPILLVVGGNYTSILVINRRVIHYLQTKKQLALMPNVTHLYEKPSSLEEAARLAMRWFDHYLTPVDQANPNAQHTNEQSAIEQS